MIKNNLFIIMNISTTITKTLEEFNHQYHQTNPIGRIIEAFEKSDLKADTEFPIPSVDYGKTEKINLIIEGHPNKVLVNLYRMDSGSYEVNAYEAVMLKETNKKRSKLKP